MSQVTQILVAIEQGDVHAQKVAQERPGQTLQATALVHEAYIRLVGGQAQKWNSKGHFFKAAAEAMRRILIENARRKKRIRHGGGHKRVNLSTEDVANEIPSDDLIALDEALEKLSYEDKGTAELIKLRFFAGLTMEQAAETLEIPTRTADRNWAFARAWLYKEIKKSKQKAKS